MALKALGIDGQALRAGGGGQPADLVERYCAKLQLAYGAIAATRHVATAVQEQAIGTGKSPISLASACIYLVCQLSEQASRRSFAAIAAVSGVAEATIQKAYQDIYPHRQVVVPGPSAADVKWEPAVAVDALPPA